MFVVPFLSIISIMRGCRECSHEGLLYFYTLKNQVLEQLYLLSLGQGAIDLFSMKMFKMYLM